MEKQSESYEGKRVKQSGKGAKIALFVCAGVVVVLAAAYAGLCAWASGHILPRSSAAGVELGGLSHARAEERLEEAARNYRDQSVDLVYEQMRVSCELDKAGLAFDTEAVLDQLTAGDKSFPARGAAWIGALAGGGREAEGALSFQDELYMDGLLSELNAALTQPMEQHEAETGENAITFTRGRAGMNIDTAAVEEALLERIARGDSGALTLEPAITEPDDPDFEELYRQVYTQPQNAVLDPETYEITPSVTGVSFDTAAAQALFERSEPGESFQIPLKLTEPEITTEKMEASLFADKLGEAVSTVNGSSGRKSNVKLASSLVHETILLPGEEFSYWSKIAPCTREQGFQPAPTYLDGKTVDGIGGGVCQVSSSIYYAALHANLEIVQRNQHTYSVGYLPNGGDAMVSSGSSDFKFKNNTQWPIKITAGVENSKLTVQIWGTKTDDTYVKMEFNNLSSTPYGTVYQIDESVPAGTTKVENGYTGYKNETYRCVYAGDGTLISRTLESKNNYRMRDKVVRINPADAAQYGLDAEGNPLPEPTPTPEPSPEPVPEPTPTPDVPPAPEDPAASETPETPAEPSPTPENPSDIIFVDPLPGGEGAGTQVTP